MAYTCSTAFHILYVTLAVNKMDGCGLSNTGQCEKLNLMPCILVTEGGILIDPTLVTRQSTSVIKVSW